MVLKYLFIFRYSRMIAESINIENLRFDILKKIKKRRVIHAIFPYFTTSKFLKDKMQDK